jgi:hypothetical protein
LESEVFPFALTVIVAVPLFFAVIVIVVTFPLLDVVTVATDVLLDVAVTVKSPASDGVTVAVNVFVAVPYVKLAVSVEVLPFVKVNDVLLSEIAVGLRVTLPDDSLKVNPLAVLAFTFTEQVALLLFEVFAVIVAFPTPFAVTVPFDTVATEVDELVQVTAESLVTVKAYVLESEIFPLALTVIVAAPFVLAVIVIVVTFPFLEVETVATLVLLLVHVTA